MSLPHRLFRRSFLSERSFARLPSRPCTRAVSGARRYATHRDPTVNLSQTLDTRQRPFRTRESVSPFALGMSRGSSDEKVKKWSELSTGGKVRRTTARTTNLTVILFGAGLSAVLVYCLTSELFSKNSPTVLHNQACEKIKASPQVAKYLHGPLVFHNNPPNVVRPRHRNHHVTSQIVLDPSGREHMLLNFFVQGRELDSEVPDTYWDAAMDRGRRLTEEVTHLTWDRLVEIADNTWENSKQSFKYLIGTPVPTTPTMESLDPHAHQHEVKEERSGVWKLTGMFDGLRGSRGPREPEVHLAADGKVFTEGEVHADLVRNNDGYFVFRYILIDIPDSRSKNPIRVFVERGPGVKETERVMKWYS